MLALLLASQTFVIPPGAFLDDLQEQIEVAPAGSIILVQGGLHDAVHITKPLTLIGEDVGAGPPKLRGIAPSFFDSPCVWIDGVVGGPVTVSGFELFPAFQSAVLAEDCEAPLLLDSLYATGFGGLGTAGFTVENCDLVFARNSFFEGSDLADGFGEPGSFGVEVTNSTLFLKDCDARAGKAPNPVTDAFPLSVTGAGLFARGSRVVVEGGSFTGGSASFKFEFGVGVFAAAGNGVEASQGSSLVLADAASFSGATGGFLPANPAIGAPAVIGTGGWGASVDGSSRILAASDIQISAGPAGNGAPASADLQVTAPGVFEQLAELVPSIETTALIASPGTTVTYELQAEDGFGLLFVGGPTNLAVDLPGVDGLFALDAFEFNFWGILPVAPGQPAAFPVTLPSASPPPGTHAWFQGLVLETDGDIRLSGLAPLVVR